MRETSRRQFRDVEDRYTFGEQFGKVGEVACNVWRKMSQERVTFNPLREFFVRRFYQKISSFKTIMHRLTDHLLSPNSTKTMAQRDLLTGHPNLRTWTQLNTFGIISAGRSRRALQLPTWGTWRTLSLESGIKCNHSLLINWSTACPEELWKS